jgi:membrane protein YdbS with pleckstrin-like domain
MGAQVVIKDFLKDGDGDEKVLVVIRKHWLQILPILISSSILLSLSMAGLILPLTRDFFGQYYAIFISVIAVVASVAILSLYIAWILNRLTFGVLTNKRILDIDQKSLLCRQVTQARLDNIEDITVETNGLFRTLLNVGEIHIMTAGEVPNIEFMYVLDAQKTVELIHAQQDNLKNPKTN